MRNSHRPSSRIPNTNNWQRWALNLGAVLGSLCLLVAVLTLVFGLKPLVFVSGSMGPSIPTGSLGFAIPTPVAEVVPGQVISVVTTNGTRLTHRVVENLPEGLVLKGDANSVADLQPYQVSSADRLLFSVPFLGYVVTWFSQPWAFFVGGLLCAYLLYLAFFRRDNRGPADSGSSGRGDSPNTETDIGLLSQDAHTRPTRNKSFRGPAAMLTTLTLLIGLGAAPQVEHAFAAFEGSALASAGVAAALPAKPVGASCKNLNKNTIEFTWSTPASAPTGYKFTAVQTNSSGTPINGGKTNSVVLSGLETSYETSNSGPTGLLGSLLGLLLGYNYYFTVSITALYGTEWESTPVNFAGVNTTAPTLLILGDYKVTCPQHPTS